MRFNPIRGVTPPAPPAKPPAPAINRADLIKRLANASERPCLPVVNSITKPGKFCFFDPHSNTRIGGRPGGYDSLDHAKQCWDEGEQVRADEFAASLSNMTDKELLSQAEYWLAPNRGKPKQPEPKPTKTPAAATRYPMATKQAVHTKRQCPIWIVQLQERVARKEYLRLKGVAKDWKGYFSTYGPIDIHGFIFFEQSDAEGFVAEAGTSVAPNPPIVPQTAPTVSQPAPIVVAPALLPDTQSVTAATAPTLASSWRKRVPMFAPA